MRLIDFLRRVPDPRGIFIVFIYDYGEEHAWVDCPIEILSLEETLLQGVPYVKFSFRPEVKIAGFPTRSMSFPPSGIRKWTLTNGVKIVETLRCKKKVLRPNTLILGVIS